MLRVFSIRIALSKELSELLLPIFAISFDLWGFVVTNYCFQLALNYIYFILKQKFSRYENFAVLPLTFKNSKLRMWKNFPNQILKFCILFGIILQFVHSCHKLLLSLNFTYPRVKLLENENFAVSLLTFETSKKFQHQTLKFCSFLDMFLQLVHQIYINKVLKTYGLSEKNLLNLWI